MDHFPFPRFLMRNLDLPHFLFDEGPHLPFPSPGIRIRVRVPRPPYTNNKFKAPVVKVRSYSQNFSHKTQT